VNDVAIWDNRCTLHYALKDFDHSSPRHMVRMAVLGTPPGYVVDHESSAA
jgi:taurine dioxygenase